MSKARAIFSARLRIFSSASASRSTAMKARQRAQSRHVRRLPFHHRLAVFVSGFLPHVGHHQDERLGLFTSISISRIQLAE